MNWRFVGGAAGIQLQRPPVMAPFDSYVKMLFFVQARAGGHRGRDRALHPELPDRPRPAGAAGTTNSPPNARACRRSKLKLVACMISGALISAAGAPAAMYLQYADPSSAFNLSYSVSVLAMSLIGGTAHWIGPVLGAILLGATQQLLAVTISSEVNVLVLGIMLVLFVVVRAKGHHRAAAAALPFARGRQGMTQDCASPPHAGRAPAADRRPHQELWRLHRARQYQRRYSQGRALRPDRPERLGKDHADQLHFRRVASANRQRGVSAARTSPQLPPHLRARRGIARSFQIPRPFKSMTVLENLMVALDFAAARAPAALPEEDAGDVDPDADGAGVQGRRADRYAEPGGVAQDGACARDGGAPEAPDFRRSDGRAVPVPKSTRCWIC